MGPTQDEIQVFAEPEDMVWETDNDVEQVDDELPDNYLEILTKLMSKKQHSAALGAPAPVEAPTEPTEPEVQGAWPRTESPKTRHVFTLSDNVREGTLHNKLQELFKKMRKPVKDQIQIDDNLAGALTHYYAYTKTSKAINDILRQYTGIRSVSEH